VVAVATTTIAIIAAVVMCIAIVAV